MGWISLFNIIGLDYIHSKEKLVQFLMGLNESYDHMRNHILIIDPLLSMNKVYSMVLRVEKQRKIHTNVTDDFNSAMMVKEQSLRSQGRKFTKKENRHCDHYNTDGYTRDICFKLNGYPEWFAELKKKRKGKINTWANVYEKIVAQDNIGKHKIETTEIE